MPLRMKMFKLALFTRARSTSISIAMNPFSLEVMRLSFHHLDVSIDCFYSPYLTISDARYIAFPIVILSSFLMS